MSDIFYKTILDIMPQMKTGSGIFSAFLNPMWSNDYTASKLDIFFSMQYGRKHPNYWLDNFVDATTGKIDNEDVNVIASTIYELRSQEWSRWYAYLKADYDPIENTFVTEETGETKSGENLNNSSRTIDTQTENSGTGSVDTTGTGSGNTANNKYGFDSATAVGDTTGTSGTSSSTSTDTTTSNTVTDSGTIADAASGNFSEELDRTFVRHGNIGIQTAVDMIGADVEFWKWTFIIKVMEDISNLISLSVY